MIPSDELIEMLADPKSQLSVTPLINAAGQIGEGSIDIRLGPDIIVSPRATGATVFDPSDPAEFRKNLDQRQEYVRRGIGDPFLLQPGEFVIGRSLEYVTLPPDVSAEALGRSSWGRLGLVIATATLIQPGFKGTITLELANLGDTPIRLTVGLSIAQLVFQRCASSGGAAQPDTGLSEEQRARVASWRRLHKERNKQRGRYRLQIKPALSRLHEDEDLRWVTPIAVRYVLGVVGERFVGKSTMIDYLTTRHNFRLYRLTQFIQEEASRRGLDALDRRILRRVGDQMREEHGATVLAELAFEKIRSDLLDPDSSKPALPIVIEGFRVAKEIEAWQEIEAFRPVIVDARTAVRRERAIEGGWLGQDELDGYPKSGSSEEQDAWFEDNVDKREGRHPREPVIEAARKVKNVIVVRNDFDSVKQFQDKVKGHLSDLEKWWRTREY
jgi:dCTP deaminase